MVHLKTNKVRGKDTQYKCGKKKGNIFIQNIFTVLRRTDTLIYIQNKNTNLYKCFNSA